MEDAMRAGVAHAAGKYTWPVASGTQLADGANAIFNAGFPTAKIYCTAAYLTDYPLETAWSAAPVNLTQLAQTTEMAAVLTQAWHTVIVTTFTFANGTTNWWRVNPTAATYGAEYTEIYNLAVHLLTTYSGTGRRFVLQNWEGDWAFMDSFTVDTYVSRAMVDRYAAFLGVRQRAVADARKATASDCTILMAVELNRVVDARLYPHRRRILTDLARRITPDLVSFSAYDATIVDQGGWGASFAAWEAATTPVFTKALRSMQLAFPGVPIQIGEFGFPEGVELPPGRDVGAMIDVVHSIALAHGVTDFIYWQVFDNEETSPGVPRGFYTVKPDGTTSVAGAAMAALI